MKRLLGVVCVVAAAAGVLGGMGRVGRGQAAGGAELGSVGFMPTAEKPLGWRGDGTGRFPGANPPTVWGRTIKGFYSELQCAGGKQAGAGKAGELLNEGFIRDWVMVGPFDVKDFKTGVDEELIKDEATVLPKVGDKVGDKTWAHWHCSVDNQSRSEGRLFLDFAQAYGKVEKEEQQNVPGKMEPWAAYAQSSVWSPAAGKVRLRIDGTSTRKAWFNGAVVKAAGQWDAGPTVEVKAGWNNLVVKVVDTKGAWSMVAHMAPVGPYEYETKNIQWMTRMPGQSWCSPIIVGEKMFVSADNATLVCMNKTSGQVLWLRSTPYYQAVDAEERQKFADLEGKMKQLEEMCLALPAALNADISADGMKAERDEALTKKIKEKGDLEMGMNQAMAKVDKKKYDAWGNDQDWSKFNPTSDGKYVWAAFWGGNKGVGANVMTCFDLNGKRIWSQFLGQTDINEHGTHCSPILCGDYVVFKTGGQLFGFEKLTGKIAWQKKVTSVVGGGASVVRVPVGKEVLAYEPEEGLFRASDGALLWKTAFKSGIVTPVLMDGVMYGIGGDRDLHFFGLKMPVGEGTKPQAAVNVAWKDTELHMPGGFTDIIIGSPLYDKGLVYVVSEGGALNVLDARTGKRVYAQALDRLNPRLMWMTVVGICSSASLGGKYVFVRDDGAQTLVLEAGDKYKEVSKNLLMEYSAEGSQPEAQSNFYFEGQRIYFRSRGFMYCIGEK